MHSDKLIKALTLLDYLAHSCLILCPTISAFIHLINNEPIKLTGWSDLIIIVTLILKNAIFEHFKVTSNMLDNYYS